MRICNAMFSMGLGGLEQSFLDYAQGLSELGHRVLNLVRPQAKICVQLKHLETQEVCHYSQWDPFALHRIKRLLKEFLPDLILVHGNRAARFLIRAANGKIPVVGVTHNYKIKYVTDFRVVIATTQDLKSFVVGKGIPEQRVLLIPNMVAIPKQQNAVLHTFQNPMVIGVMGRFHRHKGFDTFLRALALLKKEGVSFKAVLAGQGEEDKPLRRLSNDLNLNEIIHFPGWIGDKSAFFNGIDLFCLPSRIEPFGIVLIGALAYRKPVVTTDATGPCSIVTHNKHALIVPKDDPYSLADSLKALLQNVEYAKELADNGRRMVLRYDRELIKKQVENAFINVIRGVFDD